MEEQIATLNLETLSTLTREISDIVKTCSSNSSDLSPSESQQFITHCLVDLDRKVKQIESESPDFTSLTSEELDAYLKDAEEELKLVAASNLRMDDEINALTRTYMQDSTRLEHDLEGLNFSMKFMESQGLDKSEMSPQVDYSTSLEGQQKLMYAYEDYNFVALELDHKIEKNKIILSFLKDLDYIYQRDEAVGQIEDTFTSVKVVGFEGNSVRLSLKTFVPTSEGLFYQQMLESASDFHTRDHELLIEFSDGTMEIKNVEIFPNDVVIDEIIDAVKSSREFLTLLSTTKTRSSLEWLVREVQNQIVLSCSRSTTNGICKHT